MPKTIRVSNETWQQLEEKRQALLQEKIKKQLGAGKLERTDATFEEVIKSLLGK